MDNNFGNNYIYKEITDSLCGLLRIPSVKSTPAENAPFGAETVKALEYMLNLGRSFGFETTNLDGYAGYIDFPGTSGKQVAVLCHLDVVPADKGWKNNPFEPVITDDRIIGRGTADDKGPAIASLYAMKSLKDEGFLPPCTILPFSTIRFSPMDLVGISIGTVAFSALAFNMNIDEVNRSRTNTMDVAVFVFLISIPPITSSSSIYPKPCSCWIRISCRRLSSERRKQHLLRRRPRQR